jgi:hypothetical protein
MRPAPGRRPRGVAARALRRRRTWAGLERPLAAGSAEHRHAELHEALLVADTFGGPARHGAIQRPVSMSRRLPREVRRELGLAFAPGSGGCSLAASPDSRGPGLAAPVALPGVGSPSLSIVEVVALPLPIAAVLSPLLVPVRRLPPAVVFGQVLGVLLVPAPHARLALRVRPSLRERSRLNSARGFSSPHFVQRFASSRSTATTGTGPSPLPRDAPARMA